MESSDVNYMVLCFLLAGGLSPCPTSGAAILLGSSGNAAQPSPQEQVSSANTSAALTSTALTAFNSQQQSSQRQAKRPNRMEALSKIFIANDRVDLQAPSQSVTLAEPLEIPVIAHKAGLVSLYVSQVQYRGINQKAPDYVRGSQKILQIHYRPDGSGYITVIPMRLGKVVLHLTGRYSDSGIVDKRIVLDVQQTQGKPSKLIVGDLDTSGASATRSLLSVTAKQGETWSYDYLSLSATYDGIGKAIDIDPSFAVFRIINWSGSTDPIQVDDQTGKLTPVSPGQALVETSFGGLRYLTCVDVERTVLPNRSYYRNNCKALLSPGEKLGLQE